MAISVQDTVSEGPLEAAGRPDTSSALPLDVSPLPLCFITQEALHAWTAVLGSRQRVKELAGKLRKLKIRTAWRSRKQLNTQEDAHVLTACFSQPDFLTQLTGQLPLQQLQQLQPMSITRSFLESLLGPQPLEAVQSTLTEDSHAAVEELCQRFPAARYAFGFGWGAPLHAPLRILADVLTLIETEQGPRFYQASFAAYACMTELLGTHVPLLPLNAGDKVRDVLSGVMALKLSVERRRQAEGALPLISAASLRGALAAEVERLDRDWAAPTDLLCVMARLHGAWVDTNAGFRIAAEEVANAYLLPALRELQARLETLGVVSPQGGLAIEPFRLMPHTGQLREAHIEALAPMWSEFEFAEFFSGLQAQVDTAQARAREVVLHRATIMDLSVQLHLDVQAISDEAEQVVAKTDELEHLAMQARQQLARVNEMLRTVMAEWARLASDKPSAADEGVQLLELAMQEASTLRAEVKMLKRLSHQAWVEGADPMPATAPVSDGHVQIPLMVLRKLIADPRQLTPEEVLTGISAIAQGRLRLLPSAWKSAREAGRFEYSSRMLELLHRLVFDYRDALKLGQPDAQARAILGAAYSAKESQSVSLVPGMRSQRIFLVDGVPLFFEKHLRIGNSAGAARGMRIYFEIIDDVVVIAYCGRHLTVVSSN